MRFPTTGCEIVDPAIILEEEQFDELKTGVYYPVNIGDVYHDKYQVPGKLHVGFGTTSTVWLAHDLQYVFLVFSEYLEATPDGIDLTYA